MLAKTLAVVLLIEACLCQDISDDASVRKLRFRRPRPKLIDVENPDGDLQGSPVELKLAESARSQSSGNAALEALIATAQREEPEPAQPQVLEIEEIPTQRPVQVEDRAQAVRQQRPRTRTSVPRRRPRPQGDERRRPAGGAREEPIATLERYSHKNEDGSFTFGYVGEEPIATLERYSHKNE